MKRNKQIKTNSQQLPQIKESDSETSESDMYTSSDNAARMDTTNKLRSKAATIGGSSAEDIPKNVAPPAQNKKSGLMLRVVSSVTLISFMLLTYAMGHLYYALFLLWCSFKCYFELIKINKIERKEAKIYLQSALEWYGPIGFCFYLTPYTLIRRVLVDNDSLNDFKNDHSLIYNIMFTHHSMICAMLLIFGLVLFTLSLEKGAYRYQFKRLGWQIVCTMVPISGGLFFGYYVFKGYFWVVLTNGSVMCNDIMAFVFGKTMGRTKLIALSPNKTVEGFVGGGISTVIFAIWVSGQISQFQQITCPQKEINIAPFQAIKCTRPEIYDPQLYDLPFNLFGITQVFIAPAQIHAAVIALFAALIAPFGGFFASGLKRGLKIKDFADSIPGHGGFADRFDCHIVCAFFVYMYLTQVVYRGNYGVERVFDYINKLDDEGRRQIFDKLSNEFAKGL